MFATILTFLGNLFRLSKAPAKTSSARIPSAHKPRPQSAPPAPLYEGDALQISEEDKRVARKHLFYEKDGRQVGPTPEQLAVIFSTAAGQSVLAGAGSGKSTTLVSRILFLHVVKHVPLEHMAVFTFTRKSRFDFIERLMEEALRWGITGLTKKKAESVVRTFHSKALQMSRGFRTEALFEFLGEQSAKAAKATAADDGLNEDEENANGVEGFVRLDTNPEQSALLKEAYQRRYNKSEKFRAAIAALFAYTIATLKTEPSSDYRKRLVKLSRMAAEDQALSEHLEQRWSEQHGWPIAGVLDRQPDGSRFPIEIGPHTFHANGFIPGPDVYVVLGRYEGIDIAPVEVDGVTLKPGYAVKDKELILLTDTKEPIYYVRSARDLDVLRDLIASTATPEGMAAPALRIKLPGEYKPSPAFSALHEFGGFAESLALSPDALNVSLAGKLGSPAELAAVAAVSEFFEEFYLLLEERNLITFNQVFAKLGKDSEELGKLDAVTLAGVRHLMIDEFQDVALLIVNFVLGVQSRFKATAGGSKPSLMCVGDDWQSIYGWRGSSPHFMLEFSRAFPGAQPKALLLEQNFRSSQRIIDCGQSFIEHVRKKSSKRGIAANPGVMDLPHPVIAVEEFDIQDVSATLQTLLRLMLKTEKVYLLAATNGQLKSIKVKDARLMTTTFHQSKGLEADYVVLLGAPRAFGTNPLKNALYKAAEFPQSFDEAARDEALRVAYVAATRAKKLCLWFADPRSTVLETVPVDLVTRQRMIRPEVERYLQAMFSPQLA